MGMGNCMFRALRGSTPAGSFPPGSEAAWMGGSQCSLGQELPLQGPEKASLD